MLDFARGRLAGGLSLKLELDAGLEEVLKQVVSELELGFPGRAVNLDLKIDRFFECDSARQAQMVSNLLGNAYTHGDPLQPVQLRAITAGETFEISVENFGLTIPAQIAEHLFEPFFQGSSKTGQQGLGLGLYISSAIARAHGGTLGVVSENGRTVFTFRMPITGI